MTTILKEKYGTVDNKEILQFTLQNSRGTIVKLINYGGAITHIFLPDKNGKLTDVVLGFDSLDEYKSPDNPHFGSITGRFANRIRKGQFEIDGKPFQVSINNNGNSLHGGISGFNRKVWAAEVLEGSRIKLTYTSKDGEEGFPGNCAVTVIYTLTDDNSLQMDYEATTDAPTIINLTNHSYFNLSGKADAPITDHDVWIDADQYVPVDDEFLPIGHLENVEGTAMDLRKTKKIGEKVDEVPRGGYDHTYVLNEKDGKTASLSAGAYHAGTGIYLELLTSEPGVQFYTGNMLPGTIIGKSGKVYPPRGGFCLEAQHFPDSPNHPSFPDTVLRPGETYHQTTIYRFSIK